jgi:hypothetical protein
VQCNCCLFNGWEYQQMCLTGPGFSVRYLRVTVWII